VALFSKKQKVGNLPGAIQVEDEIHGYIDEVVRQRSPILIRTKTKSWDCALYSFDIKTKLIRIEDSAGLAEYKEKPVQCGFPLDGTYFMFASKLIFKANKPHLMIPTAIQRKERRKKPRATLSSRGGAKAAMMQSLGAGVGVTGAVIELSENTFGMNVERAIMMENERKLPVNQDLLKKGEKMMVVKVSGISGVPTFTVEGVILRITQRGGWKISVQLKKLNSKFHAALGKFVTTRFMPYKPTKRSYQRRLDFEKGREKEEEEKKQKIAQQEDSNGTPSGREKITFVQEAANEPAIESVPPNDEPAPVLKPKEPVLLSIGENLKETLGFLNDISGFRWVHVESPLKIIKTLNDTKPAFLFSTLVFKRQPMLDYLEKISSMGVLGDVGIILLSDDQLPPKDLIRCRMMGIQHTLKLPLQSPAQVLDIISTH
jgi:hypothetical protein